MRKNDNILFEECEDFRDDYINLMEECVKNENYADALDY